MTIKYNRETGDGERTRNSYGPPRLFGSGGQPGRRQRFALIYVSLGVILASMSIGNVRDRFDTFENQPTLRGAGVITGKQDGALVFEVEDQSATYTPDREVFDRIEVGDRVAVLYQRSRTGGRIRIIEVGTARMR